jgi:hypothetical protein
VTGIVAGDDTITVSGLGVATAAKVVVSNASIAFVSPVEAQEIRVGVAQAVQVVVTDQGVPQAGVSVAFLATRGSITASALTDGSGRAAATISSASAGPGTITAQVNSLAASRRVEFISTTPAKLDLQASPANVGVNLSSATSNSSQLIAIVRDASDNPVKGSQVSFSADADASGGRIEPATAVTDASGVASAAFYPGPNSTGNNQIVMRARVVGSSVTDTTTLTASRQELFVRIGTGNELAVENVSYLMPWDAVVTDASGNPVPNAVVQAALVGVGFYKGRYYPGVDYFYPGGETSSDPKFWCPSEDLNANLKLDAGEDRNGDQLLTPGNVAAAYVESEGGRTDATGFARIQVKYPKGFGSWTQVRLSVTITTIAGTEGLAVRTFDLPVLAEDVSIDSLVPPGGIDSPFGVSADCASFQ